MGEGQGDQQPGALSSCSEPLKAMGNSWELWERKEEEEQDSLLKITKTEREMPLRLQPGLLCPSTHLEKRQEHWVCWEENGGMRAASLLGWSIYLEVDLLGRVIKSRDKPWALGTKERKHKEFSSRNSGRISQ